MSARDGTGSVGRTGGELWRRLRAAGAVLSEEELAAIEAADQPAEPGCDHDVTSSRAQRSD